MEGTEENWRSPFPLLPPVPAPEVFRPLKKESQRGYVVGREMMVPPKAG